MRETTILELLRKAPPLVGVDPKALSALAAVTEVWRFAPGQWLLEGGDRAEWCFFIVEGLVRELYVGEQGEEHTRTFLREGELTGSLVDLISGAPAMTWIQALEPTAVLAWKYRDFDALCARHPALHVVARRSAEALAVRKTRREHEMLALTATARHERWLAANAELDARVSRKQLASYLGVTPEHLSRLRHARVQPEGRQAARGTFVGKSTATSAKAPRK